MLVLVHGPVHSALNMLNNCGALLLQDPYSIRTGVYIDALNWARYEINIQLCILQ